MIKKFLSVIKNQYIVLLLWLIYNIAIFSGIVRYRLLFSNNVSLRILKYLATVLWRGNVFLAVVFCLFFLYLLIAFIRGKTSNRKNKIFYFFCIFSLISLFISFRFINLELRNYFNFVYSKYGLLKTDLDLLNILSIIVLTTSVAILSASKYFGEDNKNLMLIFKTPTLFFSFLSLLIMISFSFRTLIHIPNLIMLIPKSYSDRFEDYANIDFLRMETPENSKIILPPQDSKWSAISNPPIVQYFLFPRVLISSTYIKDELVAKNIGSAYFITIIKDQNRNWPDIDFKSNTINFIYNEQLNYKNIKLIKEIESGKLYLINF